MASIIFYIAVFLIAAILTEIIRRQAIRKSILDIPNHRSSHSVPTPRGGGVAIALVWYVGLIVMFLVGDMDQTLFWALFSGFILSIVSFIDDIKSLTPEIRFFAQLVSTLLALLALGGFHTLNIGNYIINNTWILTILAIPFIIWFINLFNFLDGIDGYLGMQAVVVFTGLWFFTGNNILLFLVFAVLGFLLWNWPAPKAKIFCGDVGSTLIGFNVAVFAIYFQDYGKLNIVIPLILTSLFWMDATLTLFRRWQNKEKLSEAHRKHAYQRIVQYGFSHAKTVYWGVGINVLLMGIAFFVKKNSNLAILGLLLSVTIVWIVVLFVDKKKPFPLNK